MNYYPSMGKKDKVTHINVVEVQNMILDKESNLPNTFSVMHSSKVQRHAKQNATLFKGDTRRGQIYKDKERCDRQNIRDIIYFW